MPPMLAGKGHPMSNSTWRWEPNIRVAIWGRAKCTLTVKSTCPLAEPPGAKYPGDCDSCGKFRGAKFPEDTSHVTWGSVWPACCSAKFDSDAGGEGG